METPPINPVTEEPRKNNTVLYVVIGAIVLCGCCSVAIGALVLWNNGDILLHCASLLLQLFG
jgi:hypothetical protein